MEGYLIKRGQMTAKRRYFVLEGCVLAYWGTKEERDGGAAGGAAPPPPRGQLTLGGESRVQELPRRRGFTVTVAKKAWTMTDCGDSNSTYNTTTAASSTPIMMEGTTTNPFPSSSPSTFTTPEEIQRWLAALTTAITTARRTSSSSSSSPSSTLPPSQPSAHTAMIEARYTATVSGTDFVLDKRYDSIRPLGHGAYGVVVSAIDRQTNEKVAIKKCPNVFEDPLDAKRIAREIRLLRHFTHPNIIKLTDLPVPASADFTDMYMIAEQMDTDLHRVIYSGQKLTEEHVQFFLYQLLCGIRHIHSADVIHRDLKPSNILLNENCDLKICDFGLARDMGTDKVGTEVPSNLTEYVVTRWYRAPEIMLSSQEYSKSIDIWAVGCIFGEMLGRKPLFPGNDYIHQLKLITKTIGTPQSEADLWFVKNPKAKTFMLQLPSNPPQDLSKRFPDTTPEALTLLSAMLQLDYQKRITVDQALDHPYFASVRDTAMEFLCPAAVPWGDLEKCKLTRGNLQRAILEDIVCFHPEEARELLEIHRRAARAQALEQAHTHAHTHAHAHTQGRGQGQGQGQETQMVVGGESVNVHVDVPVSMVTATMGEEGNVLLPPPPPPSSSTTLSFIPEANGQREVHIHTHTHTHTHEEKIMVAAMMGVEERGESGSGGVGGATSNSSSARVASMVVEQN